MKIAVRVGVLMGGRSAERAVSLRSGEAVLGALRRLGIDAMGIDVDASVVDHLTRERVGLAFIALHGRYGEDGTIQGLLEMLGIPYTGSGVLASALGMDKLISRALFAAEGLPVPRYVSLKGSVGNARRGPGLTHRIDWVFTRAGMPLKVTAEYEHWRRVEDADGVGGWVNFALLSGVRTVLVTQDMAEAFSQPDGGSDVLYQSELGVIGKLLQCAADWCRISVDGETGWLRKDALWGVTPDEIFP